MSAALQLVGITKRYGAHVVLDDVDLEVPAGQLRAVIGPNGAGKSTLFGVISGEHAADVGRVLIAGEDVTTLSAHRRVRRGVARAFQVARVFPRLNVRDNVLAAVLARRRQAATFWRPVGSLGLRREIDALLELTALGGLADRLAGALPQGDRKRLEITMALALQARLLLLDEPTAGMSPEETAATVQLVDRLWRQGNLTVVLTEHDMNVVFKLAQAITVLHRGAVVCTGAPEAVRQRADVREIYLGQDDG